MTGLSVRRPCSFHGSLHHDDEQFEQLPLETHTSLDLYGQLNDTQRGTGDPAGTPASPTNVEYSFHTAPEWSYRTTEISRYMAVSWDANSESDLRGYWVEFSYSDNGPWHRFTDKPLAWWETTYFKLAVHTRDHDGLESCPSSWMETPCDLPGYPACIYEDDCDDLDCLHVRVIAVDEAGNESLPAKPSDHPRAGCPTTAAPSAPTGLSAAYNGHVQPYPPDSECQTRLSWDDSGAESYEIHRLVWWDANSWFYKTGETAGTSCSGGTCHFDESGDHKENATLANTPCPLHINAGATFHANSCAPDFWQAFYVIAKDHTASGTPIRSAPSEILWFNCRDAAASAMLWPQQSESDPLTLFAQAEVCEPASVEQSFALLAADVATDAGDRAMPRAPEPALASEWLSPPATLGQSSSNPPYRVFNVHVDHLGSTRRLTNPWGTVVEEHEFLPFGEEIAPVYSRGGKMFTGHERDLETGLDYMLARYYSGSATRFCSSDPVLGNPKVPISWNRYAYVENNPITLEDPSGMCSAPAGGNGVCVEAFIASKRINVLGLGDNRGFSGTDPSLSARVRVHLAVDQQSGTVSKDVEIGKSEALFGGLGRRGDANVTATVFDHNDDGSMLFGLDISGATNGLSFLPLAPKESIDMSVYFRVDADGGISLQGGAADGYPSIGIYSYQDGDATTLLELEEGEPADLAPPRETPIPVSDE